MRAQFLTTSITLDLSRAAYDCVIFALITTKRSLPGTANEWMLGAPGALGGLLPQTQS